MCGRFAVDRDLDELAAIYGATPVDQVHWEPSWNLKPTQSIPVILESAAGEAEVVRRAAIARWSLTPIWSKTLATRFSTFNARIESVTEKASFKSSVKSRRAIVPAAGYYEWTTKAGIKQPHYIHLPEGEPLALAGLYSWWADPAAAKDTDTRWHLTVTMLTCDAVQTIADVHDREPVPLPADLWDDWLNPQVEGDQEFLGEAVQASLPIAARLIHHQVAPLKGDGSHLIEPTRT
ncbi:SOS response-associated peptidase [Rarobacter faecitabidus]|nr:SOS response-associated peptidase [Rarobacter faecitabidus]